MARLTVSELVAEECFSAGGIPYERIIGAETLALSGGSR
jgi:hypothetical protein